MIPLLVGTSELPAQAGSLGGFARPKGTRMRFELTGDELILALISLIRATNPAMLRQGPDGFTVDFEPLAAKSALNSDEQLLLRLRSALETPGSVDSRGLELDAAEGHRLAETLQSLEALQSWPADVLELSRKLRARLFARE